jgi:type II secretory pathway component PulJ
MKIVGDERSFGIQRARHIADEGGFTLMELIAAAFVFSVVGLAIGAFYVFTVQRVEEGVARARLQRNGSLVLRALGSAIRSAETIRIPAVGESAGGSSVTAVFPPEPFEDHNLNGTWDSEGAEGVCAPQECFQDQNGNGAWDARVSPDRSFRLHEGRLEVREGNDGSEWSAYLDDVYPEPGSSSAWMEAWNDLPLVGEDESDAGALWIRFSLRDDRRTPEEGWDDVNQAFELLVPKPQ